MAGENEKRDVAGACCSVQITEQFICTIEFPLPCALRYGTIKALQNDEVLTMPVSYNKLWKLLIDKNMKRTDLRKSAKISTGTLAKLGKNEGVSTDVLVRICRALDCDIGDIMEV